MFRRIGPELAGAPLSTLDVDGDNAWLALQLCLYVLSLGLVYARAIILFLSVF